MKKTKSETTPPQQPDATDTATSAVWKDATAIVKESIGSTPDKISVELTREELYAVITGLYSTYKTLDSSELKSWKGKASTYRELALRLDRTYDKHSYPKAYKVVMSWESPE